MTYIEPQPRLAPDHDDPPSQPRSGEHRALRRRRALRRLDVVIGLVVAGIGLIVAPGMAMVGIVAVFALLVAGISFGVERLSKRRRRRRRTEPA